jgi:hypothetical protein
MSLSINATVLLSIAALSTSALAQDTATNPSTAPIPAVKLDYRFVPDYFVEWLGSTDQPYSIIEAFLNDADAAKPSIEIVLTDRATSKRVHYVNTPELAKAAPASEDVHVINIAYKAPQNTPDAARTWAFGLRDTQGTVVQWRFLQGSDFSDAGQGLSPRASTPGLRLEYRENGAVAGDGSLVQVGASTNRAEVWNEHSTPPYFIAYHGAHTRGLDIIDIQPGDQNWNAKGSESDGWTISSLSGQAGTLKLKEKNGASESFTLTSSSATISPMVVNTTAGYQLQSLELGDKPHTVNVLFQPQLGPTPAAFSILVRKKKIAEGTAQTLGQQTTFSVTAPAWAAGRQIKQTVAVANSSNGKTQASITAAPTDPVARQ